MSLLAMIYCLDSFVFVEVIVVNNDINSIVTLYLVAVNRDQERQQRRCFYSAAHSNDCCSSEY